MQPDPAHLQAVLATLDLHGQLGDLDGVKVRATRHFFAPSSGSQTWKTVPPSPVSNEIEPRWRCSTMRRAVSSPMPVPEPGAFVVKKGSKICVRASAGIPGPSSAMSTLMQPLSRHVVILISPCSPSAPIALSSRFVQTWLSSEPYI